MKKPQFPSLVILYAALALLFLSVGLYLDAGVLWLVKKYFIFKHGSSLYRQEAHLYHAVAFAVLTLICAAAGYFISAFIKRIREPENKKEFWLLVLAGALPVLFISLRLALKMKFYSGLLAVAPVLVSYLCGSYLGLKLKAEDNPFKNLKLPF